MPFFIAKFEDHTLSWMHELPSKHPWANALPTRGSIPIEDFVMDSFASYIADYIVRSGHVPTGAPKRKSSKKENAA